ncbi:DUF4432 family protein [Paenibacillus sp. sgz302251]|uniref:DUF4432 family protein n=1 Tax=Paenibacillus sp. sgz302251 TaxID=3414493 RepID=UPI003C7E97F5
MERLLLSELNDGERITLPTGGSIEKRRFSDEHGGEITVLAVDNGLLEMTILPERGMENGEIRYNGELMSWERNDRYLLHPDQVDLQARNGTGWLDGFYSAVASIGPELFGTPGEGYTLHGTASYSSADPASVFIEWDDDGIRIEGRVACRGYASQPVFVKSVSVYTRWNAFVFLKEETTVNISDRVQTLDDGHHIQLSGSYLQEGGRYVLPTAVRHMLLRDNALSEEDPLRIPPLSAGTWDIRCYQYVPESVSGLEAIEAIAPYMDALYNDAGITAEMIVNEASDGAAFVVRPLDCFPRSLIAKEIGESFLFSFEPCRTRPNRLSQKHTDGEAFLLNPGADAVTKCLIGVTRDKAVIQALEKAVKRSIKS